MIIHNLNNFIQVNYNYDNMEKIFLITGATSQKFYIYDYNTNEMQYIGMLKFSHNWWPSLIPVKIENKYKKQLLLFCLSGTYTNKCELLIFKDEEIEGGIINELDKNDFQNEDYKNIQSSEKISEVKEEEKKYDENNEEKKEEEKKEEEKKEEEKKEEEIKEEEKKEEEIKEEEKKEEEKKEEEIKEEEKKEEEIKYDENEEEEEKEELKKEKEELSQSIKNSETLSQKSKKKYISKNTEYILKWQEIPSTKGNHGQGASFIYNNKYLYLLFGYNFKLDPITLIERLNIENINNLIIDDNNNNNVVNWESLEFKNPNDISSILYYNALLKVNDDKIYVLGGLKEIDEIDVVYEYSVKDNALLKTDKKINFENVKFSTEKNFLLLNKDNDFTINNNSFSKKDFGIIDGKNNVHLVNTFFEHKVIPFNP